MIPCYNHEQFVQDSIQSVIDQTYLNIELIIIDDGSKDSSVDKIQQMIPACEQRFTRFEFRSRPNKGLSATLNEALTWCKGAYYCAIASDDMMISYRIQKQVNYLELEENKGFYACSGSQVRINDSNEVLEKKYQKMILKKREIKNKKNIFNRPNNIFSPTTIFRTKDILNLGGYNEEIYIEDLYIFYMAALNGLTHLQVTDVFTYYRIHNTNNHSRYLWMHENKLKILAEFKGKPEYRKLEKLVYLEGFYSLSKNGEKKAAWSCFRKTKIYFYHPYFIFGFIYLILRG